MFKTKTFAISLIWSFILFSGGCTIPHDGPSTQKTMRMAYPAAPILINVDGSVLEKITYQRKKPFFPKSLQYIKKNNDTVAAGDSLDISIWEVSPALLFSSAQKEIMLPTQVISQEGHITIPFVGKIAVAHRNLQQIQNMIREKLQKKANNPQVLVRLHQNVTQKIIVMGEVNSSRELPLTSPKKTVLDALAAAQGVKTPINKTTIQLTRNKHIYSLPLENIIADPQQNISLQTGDIITALYQPKKFTALGAIGKNVEIDFENKGINLTQALSRVGGLLDFRSDAKGVFVFRYESPIILRKLFQDRFADTRHKIPIVYHFDFNDPKSLFFANNFGIEDNDMIYVSTASLVDAQKMASIILAASSPLSSTYATAVS